jgi:hypothetical protein
MRRLALLFFGLLCPLLGAIPPGTYIGTWSGAASGEFRMKLTTGDDGKLNAEVMFTMGTNEVQTKIVSLKVDGDQLNVVYQYDLQGTKLQSDVRGELKDNTLSGTYKATLVNEGTAVDEGTWTASTK